MQISILTLFPEMFVGSLTHSILKHAQIKNLVTIKLVNIRDFGIGKHKQVDDTPYGGGTGMVMRVDVLHAALQASIKNDLPHWKRNIVLLSAKGRTYNQTVARSYSQLDHLILICGHYEGVDERILHFIDEEISVGEYVLTGGEIPALAITDSVIRLIPGVLKPEATAHESFSLTDNTNQTLLEYPQYTRPEMYANLNVPDILLQGNHRLIDTWRIREAQLRTKQIKTVID